MAQKRRTIVKSEYSPMFRHFVNLLVNRIVVDNLPDEVDEKFLLYHVLLYGRILFFKKSGKYHVMWFSGRGKLNEYYIQNEFLVTNPWADNTSGDYDKDNACILYSDINAYIDNVDCGLYDFIEQYTETINAIDASIRALAKNCKVIGFITGASSSLVASAKQMVKGLLDSDDCIGICEESLVDSIKVNPISTHMDYKFSELVKTRQYLISDFYSKLGIASNQNMKAERMTDNESQLVENVSAVDFNHILDNLNYSVKFINDKFGLNISFRLNEDENEEKVVNNSGVGSAEDNNGNDTEGNEAINSESGVSGSENVSSGNIDSNTGEENPDVASGNSEILNALLEAIKEKLCTEKEVVYDGHDMAGKSSGVRGNEQSDVSGLPVSPVATDSERESESSSGEVVNNSGTEEVSAETKDVEINVEINVNDEEKEKEKEVEENAETSVSE